MAQALPALPAAAVRPGRRSGASCASTQSPTAKRVTPAPTATTLPAPSTPSAAGGRSPTSQLPPLSSSSHGPTPAASTAPRIWPGPGGDGSGNSSRATSFSAPDTPHAFTAGRCQQSRPQDPRGGSSWNSSARPWVARGVQPRVRVCETTGHAAAEAVPQLIRTHRNGAGAREHRVRPAPSLRGKATEPACVHRATSAPPALVIDANSLYTAERKGRQVSGGVVVEEVCHNVRC